MRLIRLCLDGNEVPEEPKIILSLTLPKCYAVLAGMGTLLVGAFTLGIFYRSYATELQVTQKNIELARLNAKFEDLRKVCPVTRTKGDFLVLRSRLRRKKNEAVSFPSNKELQKEVKDTEKQLAILLEENINNKPDENGIPIISVVLDDKDSKDSKIRFRGESESYEIPQGVKKLTKNITWNNAVTTPLENAMSIFPKVQREGGDSPELLESSRDSCPLRRTSSFPTQRRRTLEIKKYYPAIIQP